MSISPGMSGAYPARPGNGFSAFAQPPGARSNQAGPTSPNNGPVPGAMTGMGPSALSAPNAGTGLELPPGQTAPGRLVGYRPVAHQGGAPALPSVPSALASTVMPGRSGTLPGGIVPGAPGLPTQSFVPGASLNGSPAAASPLTAPQPNVAPAKPLSKAEQTGKQIGDLVTRNLEGNDELQAEVDRLDLDHLDDKARRVLGPIVDMVPDFLKKKMIKVLPPEWQPLAQRGLNALEQPVEPASSSKNAEAAAKPSAAKPGTAESTAAGSPASEGSSSSATPGAEPDPAQSAAPGPKAQEASPSGLDSPASKGPKDPSAEPLEPPAAEPGLPGEEAAPGPHHSSDAGPTDSLDGPRPSGKLKKDPAGAGPEGLDDLGPEGPGGPHALGGPDGPDKGPKPGPGSHHKSPLDEPGAAGGDGPDSLKDLLGNADGPPKHGSGHAKPSAHGGPPEAGGKDGDDPLAKLLGGDKPGGPHHKGGKGKPSLEPPGEEDGPGPAGLSPDEPDGPGGGKEPDLPSLSDAL